jgi:phosphate transport system protein
VLGDRLEEADDEMNVLHRSLTNEVAAEGMPTAVAAQVTLLARFYERLGDHAVNLARRIELLQHADPDTRSARPRSAH